MSVERNEPGWIVTLADGSRLRVDDVVLATDPAAARRIVPSSDGLPLQLKDNFETIGTAAPYMESRFWTDHDVAPQRAFFSSVAREPLLDSVGLFHRAEGVRPSGSGEPAAR